TRHSADEPVAPQQGVRVRLAAAEALVELHRVLGAPALEHVLAKTRRHLAVEDAPLLEELERVGVEHLGPLVAVVTGRIAAREDVRKAARHDGPRLMRKE